MNETKQKTKFDVLGVNNFSLNVATANGTGSQTSNIAILRALFRMGIAVNGKNLFPSNIQGLPTWYKIRLSQDGFLGYQDRYHCLVAMNKATYEEDITRLESGGHVFYDESLPIEAKREDIHYYAMPIKSLVKQIEVAPSLRSYIANMVYVGVVAEFLDIELEEIRKALLTHFKGKEKAVALNMNMIQLAIDWTKETHAEDVKNFPFKVKRVPNGNQDKILVEGNAAAALGAIYGGVSVSAWYPITPSTSVIDGINDNIGALRKDQETGKNTYAIVQAEDELAAIGAVLGAGWAGARAMTATSGPGISLMAEFAGMGYLAEIPGVIWDIQRVGPSTGLPTRTSQGDVLFTHFLGHGDTRQLVLLPSTPDECFEMGYKAFDISEQFQTPVFVLSDLDVGMNLWISDEFEYPQQPMNRGKVLSADDLNRLQGQWGRYKDVDGDGIPYRTIPGTNHLLAGYFTRGTGHNEYAKYSERPEDWENNLHRINKKINHARDIMPSPRIESNPSATIGILTYGSNTPSVSEAVARLKADGMEVEVCVVKALPVHSAVTHWIEKMETVFVVENNMDGQMCKILTMDSPQNAMRLKSISRCNGLPLEGFWIANQIQEKHQEENK